MAKKKEDFSQQVSEFADRLKSAPVPIPIQQVVPVATPSPVPVAEEETLLAARLPKSLMKAFKVKLAQEGKTQKQVIKDLISQYINS